MIVTPPEAKLYLKWKFCSLSRFRLSKLLDANKHNNLLQKVESVGSETKFLLSKYTLSVFNIWPKKRIYTSYLKGMGPYLSKLNILPPHTLPTFSSTSGKSSMEGCGIVFNFTVKFYISRLHSQNRIFWKTPSISETHRKLQEAMPLK